MNRSYHAAFGVVFLFVVGAGQLNVTCDVDCDRQRWISSGVTLHAADAAPADRAYLDKNGSLRHAIVLKDAQTGFAGDTGRVLTIEPNGSWRSQTFLNAKLRKPDRSGNLTKAELRVLASKLAKQDLLGLPPKLGKDPGVNPHTFTITFGKKRSSMILTGGADVPKADPSRADSAEQRFAAAVRLLRGLKDKKSAADTPERNSKLAFPLLRLEMKDADDVRSMAAAEPGKRSGPAHPMPLAIGQKFSLRFISRYANGRPAYRLAKFDTPALRRSSEPIETVVKAGPYKGNKRQTVDFVAHRAGDAKIELGFGSGATTTTFTFRVHEKRELEAIVAKKKQGVTGLVIALMGNQQPRVVAPARKGKPISVPIHVFRGQLQPFEKPQPRHESLVKIIRSDKRGRFTIVLRPGVYSLVPEIGGKLQTSRGEIDPENGRTLWPSVRVFPGQQTLLSIVDTSGAVF